MSSEPTKDEVYTNSIDTQKLNKYTLIITEKPDAAKRIAQALDTQGKPKLFNIKGVPYFVAQRDTKILVVPSIGHLYTIVHERGKKNHYPVFNYKWVPRHLTERKAKNIQNWIEAFSTLSRDADKFISACDFDIEGSLIGYFILKYACGKNEDSAKRMKFSTLMKNELEQAYDEPLSHLDFNLIDSGRTRHEVDWLYGINLSRALTFAARNWSGRYSTLSTGRVQGPTLKFLAERERAIVNFVPKRYWKIIAEAEILNSVVDIEYETKRIETSMAADAIVKSCMNKIGEIVKINYKTFHKKPPVPFDIGSLQRETYNLFGYSPRQTLAIAQHLYLDALISYPRTSSQKLPAIIGYRTIFRSLKRQSGYNKLALKLLEKEVLKPREGKQEDSAHPAIYPTGKLPEKPMGTPHKRVWDIIVRRFMAVFGDVALKQSFKAVLKVNGYTYFLREIRIIKEGWMVYFAPYIRSEELKLPPIKEGDRVLLKNVIKEEKFTCPLPRYNPSTLLKKMEECGIGTKATRADIIQTLYNRGYVNNEQIAVTKLGFKIIEILSKYAPIVVSAQLTKDLECKMEQIKNGILNRDEVIEEVVKQLKSQLEHFKEHEKSIGEALSKATKRIQTQSQIVGKCPTCETGDLIIICSKKTKKRFIGCSNYFNGICKTSFPLPQRGTVKPIGNRCKICGWPQVLVSFRSRKPWTLCLNPNCTKKS